MTVQVRDVSDLTELVTTLLSMPHDRSYWYRGQGCARRTLQPSLIRRLEKIHKAALTPAIVMGVEERLLTRFRQHSLPFWPAGYPMLDWEHLFAMQHHRLPTRLLDWTKSALVAAYFALDHDRKRCECKQEDCTPTVWALEPVSLNQQNKRLDGEPVAILATSDPQIEPWQPRVNPTRLPNDPVAMYGAYNNDRIAAQQGSFTVAGASLLPLEDALAQPHYEGDILTKIQIVGDLDLVKRQLRLLGVSRSTVYPGLEQVALDIAEEELR